MDVDSPPKRMTRSRAAAASAGAAAAATAPPTSTTAAKANKSTKTPAASAKSSTRSIKTAKSAKAAASKTPATTPAIPKAARQASGKRKTRTSDLADDDNEEDDLSKDDAAMNHPAKKARGRAKKADVSSTSNTETKAKSQTTSQAGAQEATVSTRSITARSTTARSAATRATATKATPSEPPATQARATRGRPRKTPADEIPSVLKKQTPHPISRTRTRKTAATKNAATDNATAADAVATTSSTGPTPVLKSAVSRPESKVDGALKKTVTFKEPEKEKENIAPASASKAKAAADEPTAMGMRAKPVRKAAASGRTTRASSRAATAEPVEKKPLSPKKDVQNRSLSRDAGSDDELATYEKTPLRPLMKSPVKPPSSVRKIELPRPEKEVDENSQQPSEPSPTSTLASPARRPPASPLKDTMKSPAKKADGVATLLFPSANSEVQGTQTPVKSTLLQSPAKRNPMLLPALQQPSLGQAGPSPSKASSLFSTPARRPASPIKLPGSSVSRAESHHQDTTEVKQDSPAVVDEPTENELLQSQPDSEIQNPLGREPDLPVVQQTPGKIAEDSDSEDELQQLESPSEAQLEFPGRLSAVLPRHADPALKNIVLPMAEPVVQSSVSDNAKPQLTEDAEMSDSDATADYVDALSSAESLKGDSVYADALSSQGLKDVHKMATVLEESPRQSTPESEKKPIDAAEIESAANEHVQTVHGVAEHQTSDALDAPSTPSKQEPLGAVDELSLSEEKRIYKPTPRMLETARRIIEGTKANRFNPYRRDGNYSYRPLGPPVRGPLKPLSTDASRARVEATVSGEVEPGVETATAENTEPEDTESKAAEGGDIESEQLEPNIEAAAAQDTEPEGTESKVAEEGDIESEQIKPDIEAAAAEDTEPEDNESKAAEGGDIESEQIEPDIEAAAAEDTEPEDTESKAAEGGDIDSEKAQRETTTDSEALKAKQNEPEGVDLANGESEEVQRDTAEPDITEATNKRLENGNLAKPEMTMVQTASILPTIEEEDEGGDEYSPVGDNGSSAVKPSQSGGFFEDEMKTLTEMERRETEAAMVALLEADIDAKFDKHNFQDISLMPHMRLATPPNGRKKLNVLNHEVTRDGTVSEASQEYGDENAVPIDPALLGMNSIAKAAGFSLATPKRPLASTDFETTPTKVPAKRGHDSPPRNAKRHCSPESKAFFRRPDDGDEASEPESPGDPMDIDSESYMASTAPETPSKPDTAWSSTGTPARSPRRDLKPGLLSGAIVYVDVHTTEGADAGRLFVELLLSMGARCVKNFPWNPTNTEGQVNTAKVGITHVVFKDGSRSTLEKVVESNGVVKIVQCGWVLDCEKYNTWLPEAEYRVDTSLIPRGGHNRRQSMEPTALSNQNGVLVTPARPTSSAREPQTVPNNYMSRRDSTLWARSPSAAEDDEDAPSEQDWMSDAGALTPVPQTPAPEAVAEYAMNVSPATPTNRSIDLFSPSKNEALTKTCPPKPPGGLMSSFEAEHIARQVSHARRQSLQYAPKVSSPLKRQWKPID